MGRRKAAAVALAALAGCAAPPRRPCGAQEAADAWVVDNGWHLDIALRPRDLDGPLAQFRALFAGADALVFGFGKRSFVLAEAGAVEQWLLGPIPGPGTIMVKGLRVAPPLAYPGRVAAVTLPDGGQARLSAFLWTSFALDAANLPMPSHPQPLHGALFYEARRRYSLAYTCNTWAAEALRVAGLPVSEHGVVLAGALLAQLPPVACAA